MYTEDLPMSWGVKAITACVVALFAAIPLSLLFIDGGPVAVLMGVLMTVLMAVGIALPCWFFWRETPVRLEIDERALRVIMRSGSQRRIPLSSVIRVEPLQRRDVRWALRLGGNGGCGGFTGLHWNRRLGYFTLYSSGRKQMVRLDTLRDRYVVGVLDAAVVAVYIRKQIEKRG